MKRFAFVILTLALFAGSSLACDVVRRRTYATYTPTVVTPVVEAVVTPVLAATFIPVPVAVPQYSVGPAIQPVAPVAATAPAAAAVAPNREVEALKLEILKLRQELEAARKPAAPVTPAPLTPPTPQASAAPANPAAAVAQVFTAKCASCHDKAVSAQKGGSFTILDGGKLATLNDRSARLVASRLYTGRMPPPKSGIAPCTDEEVGLIMAFLDTLK